MEDNFWDQFEATGETPAQVKQETGDIWSQFKTRDEILSASPSTGVGQQSSLSQIKDVLTSPVTGTIDYAKERGKTAIKGAERITGAFTEEKPITERLSEAGRGAVELIGGAAGVVTSPIVGLTTPFIKMMTPAVQQKYESLEPETQQKIVGAFNKLEELKTEYPVVAEGVNALLDLAGMGPSKAIVKETGALAKTAAKEVPELVESGVKATGEVLESAKGAFVKPPEEVIQKATTQYREVLKPSKGEITNVEVRGKKNIDDYYRLAAEEGLPIEASADGKTLDTVKARNILSKRMKEGDDILNSYLETDPSKKFDLESIGLKAKEELRKTIKNDTDYKAAAKDVDEFIADSIAERGKMVSAKELNEFKRGMWSLSYNQLKPTAQSTARKIGHIAKEAIEDAFPDAKINEINQLIGDYATLNALLESSHGKVISGGALTKKIAQLAGTVAGAPFPVVGSIGGWYLGGKLAEFLADPARVTTSAAKKAKAALEKLQAEGKTSWFEQFKIPGSPLERIVDHNKKVQEAIKKADEEIGATRVKATPAKKPKVPKKP